MSNVTNLLRDFKTPTIPKLAETKLVTEPQVLTTPRSSLHTQHVHHRVVRVHARTGEVQHGVVQVLGQVRGQNLGENVSVSELIRYETV